MSDDVVMRYLGDEPKMDLPALDSRTLRVDVGRETRRAIVDLIRGVQPTTVLGVLLANAGGVTTDVIARQLDRPVGEVAWRINKLEGDDLCTRVAVDGVTMALPFAAYTDRNA